MNKIDCVEEYFSGIRAFHLFQVGYSYNKSDFCNFILDKRYLNGAKVAFLSNIMLGIKEDLVETRGAMDYHSKVFLKSLENTIDFIATKVSNGYRVGNYVFPDAPSVVAIIRNKLAHGKYRIDFDHNRVILEHKGVDIVINIDRLVGFVVSGFNDTLKHVRSNEYERFFMYTLKVGKQFKNKEINSENNLRKIINSFRCVKFRLESLDGCKIFPQCIDIFNAYIESFKGSPYKDTDNKLFKKVNNFMNKFNCKMTVERYKLTDKDEIDRIIKFINSEILYNDNLNFEQKVKFIGTEVQRSLEKYAGFCNSIVANVNNLYLLFSIGKINSVNRDEINSFIAKEFDINLKYSYDEFGMIYIGMFNSLFMYPFDDVFETNGEYKINRDSSFDFSKLDLSMIKPTILNIDDAPLRNALDRCNSLIKRQGDVSQRLLIQQNNLSRVSGNSVAESKINANINDLNNDLSLLMVEYMNADSEYNSIKNDYMVNRLHFENRTIIEGIRNSIAHGNYEIRSNGKFFDTQIIFNDIYEGNNTFSVSISFMQFEELIDKNVSVVLNYIRDKIDGNIKNRSL